MEIEEVEKYIHLKPMKRARPVKTVNYLKIYERKNEPALPEPSLEKSRPRKKQETEDDFKEIKPCAKSKRRKKNSPAKKKRAANLGAESNQIEQKLFLVITVLW